MNPVDYLQYGALGLLALVMVGVAWYIRNVESRQTKREDFEHREREKYIDTMVTISETLAIFNERMQAHEQRANEIFLTLTSEHQEIRAGLKGLAHESLGGKRQ